MLAASDRAYFGFSALDESPIATVEEGQAPVNPGPSSQNTPAMLDSLPSSPAISNLFQASLESVSNHLNTAFDQFGVSQSGIPSDLPDHMPNLLDISPTQVDSLLDQFNALDNQLDLSTAPPSSDPFAIFNALPNQTDTAFGWFDNTQVGGFTLDDPNVIPNSFAATPVGSSYALGIGNPTPQPDITLQQITNVTAPPQKGYGPVPPVLGPTVSSQLPTYGSQPQVEPSIHFTLNTLAGITDEPTWMKKKHTLDFFRGTFKFGCLTNVIEHWYELEKLLGFQDTVRILW